MLGEAFSETAAIIENGLIAAACAANLSAAATGTAVDDDA
jgi:hypothetical protein